MEQINYNEYDNIINWVPDAIIDLKYYSSDNFTGQTVYDREYSQLRVGTLKKLQKAANLLRKQGYKLVIWDAFRPIGAQKIFWDIFPNEQFVAPKISKHNRGCAVDVSLANLDGQLLEMPSKFDDFTEKASNSTELLIEPIKSRLQELQYAMIRAGFELYSDEWWHFIDSNWLFYEADCNKEE